MWVLTGEFDSAPGQTRSKVLRTGHTYRLGRKDAPLSIPSNKISKTHGEFNVAKFTKDQVSDATTRPRLEYANTNPKAKPCLVTRADGDTVSIDGHATGELEDGDSIQITSGHAIMIRWEPVCCFQQPSRANHDILEDCAFLGIHTTNLQTPQVTHHLAPSYSATLPIATSLASACNLVKPEWLMELIRISKETALGNALDYAALPLANKFRPVFASTLTVAQQAPGLWEPNEERLKMFANHTFLCAGEKKREVESSLRQLLERAGGEVSVFDISGGTEKWRKTLNRNKAKSHGTLVLATNAKTSETAVGKEEWKKFTKIAREFGLRFVSSDDIVQAVISVDTAPLIAPPGDEEEDARADRSSSPLPSVVPNSFPGEHVEKSPEPAPKRKPLVRRVTRAASQDPEVVNEDPEMPARKGLIRRAGEAQMLTGLDDPSYVLRNIESESSKPKPPPPPPAEEDPDAPRPRRRQLKRRVGVAADPNDPVAQLLQQGAASFLVGAAIPAAGPTTNLGDEPPLKKFKALFEESGGFGDGTQSIIPDDSGSLDFMSSLNTQTETQTQTQSGAGPSKRKTGRSGLNAVAEEEEESQSQAPIGRSLGTKRKERSFDGDDAEMADVEAALAGSNGEGSAPPAKKRATAGVVPPVERTAQSNANQQPVIVDKPGPAMLGKNASVAATAGAAPGKPDKDAAFLKAVASTKRGKRAEDDFDRDFNNLKISKADLRVDEEENRPAWELLDDFDAASVGNFMVIEELEVFKDRSKDNGVQGGIIDERWNNKPNFKKFRKNRSLVHKEKIKLYANADQGGQENANLWDDNENIKVEAHANFDDLDDFGPTQIRKTQPVVKKTTQKKESQSQKRMVLDSDESDGAPPPASRSATQTQTKSKPPSTVVEPPAKRTRTTRTSSKAPEVKPVARLFLDDSGDEQIKTLDEDFEMQDQTQTLPTQPARRSQRAKATAKKPITIDSDDDEDDDAVFRGFKR